MDNGGTNSWMCPHCGSTGEEGFSYVFDGTHYVVVCETRGVNKDIMYGEEGVCPVCHDHVEYAGAENDDDGRMCSWCCPGCEATGSEGDVEGFDGSHYNVTDKTGRPVVFEGNSKTE